MVLLLMNARQFAVLSGPTFFNTFKITEFQNEREAKLYCQTVNDSGWYAEVVLIDPIQTQWENVLYG